MQLVSAFNKISGIFSRESFAMFAATVTNTEDLFINGLFKKNTQTDSNHVKLFVKPKIT